MKYEDTICYKVDTCSKEILRAIRTGRFDAKIVADLLVDIRSNAINMENALKANKVLRLKHNIDPEYREMMKETTTPTGINNIPQEYSERVNNEQPDYEITVKEQNGNILYQNKAFAFIFCSVERVEDIDAAGIINGQTQTFGVGHDLALFYAHDQLRQKFSAKMSDILIKMSNSVRGGVFGNREQKRELLKVLNRKK